MRETKKAKKGLERSFADNRTRTSMAARVTNRQVPCSFIKKQNERIITLQQLCESRTVEPLDDYLFGPPAYYNGFAYW